MKPNILIYINGRLLRLSPEIKKEPISLAFILRMCLEGSQFDIDDMKSKSRVRHLVYLRQAYFIVCMRLLEELKLNKSTIKIGMFVNRTHTTVLHAKKNEHYTEIKTVVDRVMAELTTGMANY